MGARRPHVKPKTTSSNEDTIEQAFRHHRLTPRMLWQFRSRNGVSRVRSNCPVMAIPMGINSTRGANGMGEEACVVNTLPSLNMSEWRYPRGASSIKDVRHDSMDYKSMRALPANHRKVLPTQLHLGIPKKRSPGSQRRPFPDSRIMIRNSSRMAS